MPCTDDDIRRFKALGKTDNVGVYILGPIEFNLLLSRLEAAEELIDSSVFPKNLDRAGQINLETWCKAAGRDK